MNRATKIALAVLVAGVGYLATQSHNPLHTANQNGWVNVSGVSMRTDDPTTIDKVAIAPVIDKINESLTINGKQVVTTVKLPVSIKAGPYIPNKGDVACIDNSTATHPDSEKKEGGHGHWPHGPHYAAIDNSGSDGQDSCEHKELPNRPHPPHIVKARMSHSYVAMME